MVPTRRETIQCMSPIVVPFRWFAAEKGSPSRHVRIWFLAFYPFGGKKQGEVRKIFSSCPRGGGLWIHRPPSPEEGDRKRIFQGRLQKRQGPPPMSAQRGEPFFPWFLPSAGKHLGEREGKSREEGRGHEEFSTNQLVPVGIFLRERHEFFIGPFLKPDGFTKFSFRGKEPYFSCPILSIRTASFLNLPPPRLSARRSQKS